MSDILHIPINRKRLLLQIMLFSAVGVGALIGGFALADVAVGNPMIWKGLGLLLCIILIMAAGSRARQRAAKEAGIRIDDEGVHDLSSDIGIGLIRWGDMKEIDKEKCIKYGLLLIPVKKPKNYIQKAKNAAVERLLNQNFRLYETPVVIEAKYLSCTIEELVDAVVERKK